MRVLITGANGFLGSHLARTLVSRGETVRAMVRRGSDDSLLKDISPLEIVEGSVQDRASLERGCTGIDVVFHLAGIRRSPSRDEFFEINAQGTRHVAEAMTQTGARRLVHCGSLAAFGPSTPNRPKQEDDPFAPQEWYGESKVESERIVWSYADRLEVCVARPARILGPGDKENLFFFRIAKKGWGLEIGGGSRFYSLVDVQDVVDLLVRMAGHPAAVGEAFFCASDEVFTLEQLMAEVAGILGIETRRIPVPQWGLRLLSLAADVVSQATGRHLPLNRKLARQLLAPGWTCSTQKAKERLGFRAQVSVADSIKQSVAWYQRHGLL